MDSFFRDWDRSRRDHQLLTSLRESIVNKPPYITGTLQRPHSFFSLFYKVAKDGHAAIHINLANTTPNELEQLAQACEVSDETEHNAGKMDTECFSSTLDPFRTDLIKIIHGYLLEGEESTKKTKFQPHKLNIYRKGSFFKPHVDTPQSEKIFGSLVIVFPTYYEGGTLFLRRHGHEWIFDPGQALSGGALDRPLIGYVAFLNDIEQDVAPVTSGHCVTLTYNLYFDDDGGPVSEKDAVSQHLIPPKPPNQDGFREAFKALLENPEFMAEGGTLAFGLRHGYPIEQRGLQGVCNILKGSDAVVYQSVRAIGFEPMLHMFYEDGYGPPTGTGVIIDVVVGFGGMFDEYTVCEIVEAEGKIPVCKGGGSIYRDPYSGTDQFENPEAMEWVTPVTKYSRQEGSFVTRDP